MKKLQESILDADFDAQAEYIEYDWFRWPMIYGEHGIIRGAHNCNAGMYCGILYDDINKLIDSTKQYIADSAKKRLMSEEGNSSIKYTLQNLETAKKEISNGIWSDKKVQEYRKNYKFLDEIFSVPLAKRLLPKLKENDVYIGWSEFAGTVSFSLHFFRNCIKVKDRQLLVDAWTKICKKYNTEDPIVINADGEEWVRKFNQEDLDNLPKAKIDMLKKASVESAFEFDVSFYKNSL